jgi:hypothetical protein
MKDKKIPINIYKDGFSVKLKNRRILFQEFKNKCVLTFVKFDKEDLPGVEYIKIENKPICINKILLSKEAMEMIVCGYNVYRNSKNEKF